MPDQTILIIGEIIIDTHLDIIDKNGPLVRLGGIFHAARAFSSFDINFVLAYYAPEYLDEDINFWACRLNTKGCYKLGNINKAPNVMLIQKSKEAGDLEYYNILKDQAEYNNEKSINEIIQLVEPSDILIFPGRYDNNYILSNLNNYEGRIHIDFHYDSINILNNIKREIETIILSTSSTFFIEICNGDLNGILKYYNNYSINRFLVKENRGGSYSYYTKNKLLFESPSFYVPTMHSVGVGDVYNSFFISSLYDYDPIKKMRLSAICAAKYAETMDFNKFKFNIQLVLKNINTFDSLQGIRLSWQDRSKYLYGCSRFSGSRYNIT
jgi:hypothetical protein